MTEKPLQVYPVLWLDKQLFSSFTAFHLRLSGHCWAPCCGVVKQDHVQQWCQWGTQLHTQHWSAALRTTVPCELDACAAATQSQRPPALPHLCTPTIHTTQTKYMETLTRTTKHHRVTASWQQAYVHVSRKSCYNLMTDYLFITTKMHLRCTIISYKCLHYNVFLKISTSVTFPKFPFQANKVYLYCLGHVKHYCDYD